MTTLCVDKKNAALISLENEQYKKMLQIHMYLLKVRILAAR